MISMKAFQWFLFDLLASGHGSTCHRLKITFSLAETISIYVWGTWWRAKSTQIYIHVLHTLTLIHLNKSDKNDGTQLRKRMQGKLNVCHKKKIWKGNRKYKLVEISLEFIFFPLFPFVPYTEKLFFNDVTMMLRINLFLCFCHELRSQITSMNQPKKEWCIEFHFANHSRDLIDSMALYGWNSIHFCKRYFKNETNPVFGQHKMDSLYSQSIIFGLNIFYLAFMCS